MIYHEQDYLWAVKSALSEKDWLKLVSLEWLEINLSEGEVQPWNSIEWTQRI